MLTPKIAMKNNEDRSTKSDDSENILSALARAKSKVVDCLDRPPALVQSHHVV
jgi:hypothetical protein